MKNREVQLIYAPKNIPLIINKIEGTEKTVHHLASLGIIKGRQVSLMDRRGDLSVVACLGSKYALGSSVTKNIYVTEAEKTPYIDLEKG